MPFPVHPAEATLACLENRWPEEVEESAVRSRAQTGTMSAHCSGASNRLAKCACDRCEPCGMDRHVQAM
jgi:hypothetical protein